MQVMDAIPYYTNSPGNTASDVTMSGESRDGGLETWTLNSLLRSD